MAKKTEEMTNEELADRLEAQLGCAYPNRVLEAAKRLREYDAIMKKLARNNKNADIVRSGTRKNAMQLIRPNSPMQPSAEKDHSSPVPQEVLDAIRAAIESDDERSIVNDLAARQAADYVKLAHQPVCI